MINDTCVVCNKKFEPREGKQYCSDACKQKAYSQRKTEKSEHKGLQGKAEVLYSFSFSELQAYNKESGDDMQVELFCFIRKNLKGEFDLNFIVQYISNLAEHNYFENVFNPKTEIGIEFNNFLKLYHSGAVEITL